MSFLPSLSNTRSFSTTTIIVRPYKLVHNTKSASPTRKTKINLPHSMGYIAFEQYLAKIPFRKPNILNIPKAM